MDLTIPQNDYGFYLNFTITDSDGAAFNLTGYTASFKMWLANNPDDLIVDGACSIISAAAGTCRYLAVDGDFDTINNYRAEIELTQAGVVESTDYFTIAVKESG